MNAGYSKEQSPKPDIYRANSFDGVLTFRSKNLRVSISISNKQN